MALRLTAAQTTKSTTGAGALEIVELARGHLLAGDWKLYRGQFAEAASMGDPHRRYRVQKALLELGFEAVEKASRADLGPLLHAVAVSGLDVLEAERREPVPLNYAAVTLY